MIYLGFKVRISTTGLTLRDMASLFFTPPEPQGPVCSGLDLSSSLAPSPAGPGPKLRDSCYACAASKVKCPKEKPSCLRCQNRGLNCEYIVTRRVGRRHDSRASVGGRETAPSNTTGQATARPSAATSSGVHITDMSPMAPAAAWFSPATAAGCDSIPAFVGAEHSPRSGFGCTCTTGLLSNFPASVESAITSNTPSGKDSSMGDCFFSNMSRFPGPTKPQDGLARSNSLSGQSEDTQSLFDVSSSFHGAASRQRSIPSSFASPTAMNPPSAGLLRGSIVSTSSHLEESACGCFMQALNIMRQLSIPPVNKCQRTPGYPKPPVLPSIRTTITKNETITKAIGEMLLCPCSQDTYLITFFLLALFKILSWYGAAARRKLPLNSDGDEEVNHERRHSRRLSHSHHSSSEASRLGYQDSVDGYATEDQELSRMVAQLVLGELHRVQRLISQITTRLDEIKGKTGLTTAGGNHEGEFLTGSPLSASILCQLGVDLKERLRTLSLEIVDLLMQE